MLSAAQSPYLAVQITHSRPSSSSSIRALSQWILLHLGRHPVPRLSLLSVLLPASLCGPAQVRNRLHADRSSPTSSHEPGFGGPKHFVWLKPSLPISGRGSLNLLSVSARPKPSKSSVFAHEPSGHGAGLLQSRDWDGMNPGVVVSPCDTV